MEAAANATPGSSTPEPKLKIDKFSEGSVTCLKFLGTVDEQFDGKKLAATVKGGTLVLDLADIQKISSFGIREWVDFINLVGPRVDEIVLVECAPKAVDQLNMVANFAGKGRVFSFYAPYRCDYCDRDSKMLLQFDRDYEAIKNMKPPERPCTSCGNPEYFDEDATSFFSFLAAQPRFEIDPNVAAFLASKLDYAVSDAARRLRVEKIVEGRSVYLKIGGELDGTFPREKLAEGMEGIVIVDVTGVGKIDPAGAAEWRGFLNMIGPPSERILLLGCPPVFLERLTRPEDLGSKAQVMSFVMPYACQKCATTTSQLVDVEQQFDVIKFATPPDMKCPDCGGPTTCAAGESLLSHLTTLVKPQIDGSLRKFIKEVQERKPEKKKAPDVATTVAEAAAQNRRSSLMTVLIAAALAALVAVGVVVYFKWQEKKTVEATKDSRDHVGKIKHASAAKRPTWVAAEEPRFRGHCAPDGAAITCVGVSSYTLTKDQANQEANDAALEALTNAIDQKIGNDPGFAQSVRRIYSANRDRMLGDLEAAWNGEDQAQFDTAVKRVSDGRSNVAKALHKTASTYIPAQPTEQYWEEYEPLIGTGSRFMVASRFTIPNDTMAKLADRYAKGTMVEGANVATVFPAVAWRFPDIQDGAVLLATSPSGTIGRMGLQAQYVVLQVNKQLVKDADDFVQLATKDIADLKEKGGDLQIVVKRDDSMPVQFSARINGAEVKPSGTIQMHPVRNPGRASNGGGGVNHWSENGGGGRDNANE
jgi:hypothetical protein